MSVYSAAFLSGSGLDNAGSPYLSATVPANQVWVLRCWTFGQDTVQNCIAVLSGHSPSGGDVTFDSFVTTTSDAQFTTKIGKGRIVFEPGWAVRLYVVEGTLDFSSSGYQLTNY